jgi:biotin synthase
MKENIIALVDALVSERDLPDEGLRALIESEGEDAAYLRARGGEVCESVYGKAVYLRGLVEFTNYCANDCFYCGLRRSNGECERYRLTEEEVLDCAIRGYQLGFRTIVLQGGEDRGFSDESVCSVVRKIKESCPDTAVTLSIGERDADTYQAFFDAGADRYLLREETASPELYKKLHPDELSLESRMNCLYELKRIGFQVGCGFMVGAPYQTTDDIIADLRFIQKFKPNMLGIGPFLPHKSTPFRDFPAGSVEMTLNLLAISRIILPEVLLPATTALGTASDRGREDGLLAGANVIMPNLSPSPVRSKYLLYDGKLCTGDEAAESVRLMERRIESAGRYVDWRRGDCAGMGDGK